MLLHGLTATRRYVVHGSRALPRARAIGRSPTTPAATASPTRRPPGPGYAYPELAADLGAVLDERGRRAAAACSPATRWAPTRSTALRARRTPSGSRRVVADRPGRRSATPPPDEALAVLGRGSPTASSAAGSTGSSRLRPTASIPSGARPLLRITRERLELHRHPEAVAQALREVPRSSPFDDLAELEFLDLPALVVASHDEADPGHPYAVAEAWAERLPRATPGQRGARGVAARLAGRQALARDRRLLRAARRRGARERLSGAVAAGARAAGPTRSRRSRRPCCRRAGGERRPRARRPRSGRCRRPTRPSARRSRALRRDRAPAQCAKRRSSSARRVKKATITSSGRDRAALTTDARPAASPSSVSKLVRRSGEGDSVALLDPELLRAAAFPSSRPRRQSMLRA